MSINRLELCAIPKLKVAGIQAFLVMSNGAIDMFVLVIEVWMYFSYSLKSRTILFMNLIYMNGLFCSRYIGSWKHKQTGRTQPCIDSNFYSSNQNNPETNINIAAPNAIYVSRECNEHVNRRRKPKAALIHSHTHSLVVRVRLRRLRLHSHINREWTKRATVAHDWLRPRTV